MGKRTKAQKRQGCRPNAEQAYFLREAESLVEYLEGQQLAYAMAIAFETKPDGTLVFRRPTTSGNG